ncbi:MAG: trypsin-like peptidase domain-containing protein [Planctomycetes bacterium]|nr:trypsin-like peptidase domain-containing protein [Planctomycetota bacterium]MBI3835445.1 trypsin-like peptidase domain-containing protein [Planctomycetota bacterium]
MTPNHRIQFNVSARRGLLSCALGIALAVATLAHGQSLTAEKDPIHQDEQARIEMIQRVTPAVVAVFDEQQRGGGSGVLIDADGFGITNFHVVAPMLGSRRGLGGLSDGKTYELQVLGIDPTGDLAMFRLARSEPFSFAALGDSDALKLGDTAIALGNPFSLSEDYTPTATMGIVTGIHRYQWGTGGNLAYTDCIQVDASINPGNSGGPLFNEAGEVVGINGRISVNTRGRYNVGFGYAISSNQIKRFIPTLRAGLLARHGSLPRIQEGHSDVVFTQVSPDSNFYKNALRSGDRLIGFDEMPIANRNQFASVVGAYPADWPIVLDVGRVGQTKRIPVRLVAVNPRMDKGFTQLGEQNYDETRRVLSAFGSAVLGKENKLPRSWHWQMTREFEPNSNGIRRTTEHFSGNLQGGAPALLRNLDVPERMVKFDANIATETQSESREGVEPREFLVTDSMQLILTSLYRAQTVLLLYAHDGLPVGQPEITHVGADALMPIDMCAGDAPPALQKRESPVFRPVLSVIQWKFSDTATAWYGFDMDSGRLAQIRIRDIPTGDEIIIQLADYKDIGGMNWPCTVEVRTPNGEFRETYSDWKIEF